MRRARLDAIPGVGPRWRRRWSRALVIARRFDLGGISRPGLGSYRSRIQAAAKTSQQHQQTRRSISTQLVHHRCSRRDPLCKAPWYEASAMAYSIVGAAVDQGCCYRTRQQDRAHGLGDNDQGRALQGTCRTRGLKSAGATIVSAADLATRRVTMFRLLLQFPGSGYPG
jgi:hypothetical protein